MPDPNAQGMSRPTRLCQDVIVLLTEYMEGGLTEAEERGLQMHLADCPPCVDFLESLKKARDAARNLKLDDVPADCRRQLREFLKKQTRPKKPPRRRS